MDNNDYYAELADKYKRLKGAMPQGTMLNQTRSLLEIQLTDGTMLGMTITAGPSLGSHLAKEMHNGGWLYAFNEVESIVIKADRVVAVKLTKITTE